MRTQSGKIRRLDLEAIGKNSALAKRLSAALVGKDDPTESFGETFDTTDKKGTAGKRYASPGTVWSEQFQTEDVKVPAAGKRYARREPS